MPIRKLLIANRAEIVSRVARTAREMDIATVAVFSDADQGLPFVTDADESVRLPGQTPAETYLRGDAIIEAAQRTGADAIHPGYGFLSENAGFARAVADAGLTFVGPPPAAIEAMGSKTAAKALLAEAGIPVLGGAVFAGPDEPSGDELRRASDEVGFPLLVKAAFGGGGRGMRIVERAAELAEAVRSARREAASAFGDGTVFLERFVTSPRHIEVQIVADAQGRVAHLFERECSIQRRYQKIIEEAPSPAVDGELRDRLCAAAVAAGRAIGYQGAGTVEFVLDRDGCFSFLEVNTRLQVEHPVTELVTGVDLVRIQLEVAAGAPLPPVVLRPELRGHAIEARLYAEDAAAGYLPTSGAVEAFEIESGPGLRVDAGYASGTRISTFYDSMLAKVIGFGQTRDEARGRLASALSRARLHGPRTNRELLVAILREEEFIDGAIDTGYLTRHPAQQLVPEPPAGALREAALAVALAARAERREHARVLRTLPGGWRNNPSQPQRLTFRAGEMVLEVAYQVDAGRVTATVGGELVPEVRLLTASGDLVDLELRGVRRRYRVQRVGAVSYVDQMDTHLELREEDRFPDPALAQQTGSLRAPMPGAVVRIAVSVGDHLEAGAPVLAIEAMKMEHAILAPGAGVVTSLPVEVGQQVDTGTVLAVIDDETAG